MATIHRDDVVLELPDYVSVADDSPRTGGGTANDGLTATLDITDLAQDLNLSDNELNELSIRVVPVAQLDAESDVKIGRLSLYTQSQ